jgi:hypothetical protein
MCILQYLAIPRQTFKFNNYQIRGIYVCINEFFIMINSSITDYISDKEILVDIDRQQNNSQTASAIWIFYFEFIY